MAQICVACGKGPLSSLNRHQKYHCPASLRIGNVAEKPKCRHCHEPMSRRDALKRHEDRCRLRLQGGKAPKPSARRRKLRRPADHNPNSDMIPATTGSFQRPTDETTAALPVGVNPEPIQPTSDIFRAFSDLCYLLVSLLASQPLMSLEAFRSPENFHDNQVAAPPSPVDAMIGSDQSPPFGDFDTRFSGPDF